jgi:hypothetical protein
MLPEFGETATLVARVKSGTDRLGQPTYTDEPTVVEGCVFAPAGSYERVQGQNVVTSTDTLYLPTGTAVPSVIDKVIVRGKTYEVDGAPQIFQNPFTGTALGAVLRLKAVTG